jgi:hypothetical protein
MPLEIIVPKMAPKHAALGDVEPGGVDLDDGDRAEALEVHVQRVEHAEGHATTILRRVLSREDRPHGDAAPMSMFIAAAPTAAIMMVLRPPILSVSGPLMRNETP